MDNLVDNILSFFEGIISDSGMMALLALLSALIGILNFIYAAIRGIIKFVSSFIIVGERLTTGLYLCKYARWLDPQGKGEITDEIIRFVKKGKKYVAYTLKRDQEGKAQENINLKKQRLEGNHVSKGNNLYIGVWHDPRHDKDRAGGFTIRLEADNTEYKGTWSGYDKDRNCINNGQWVWIYMDTNHLPWYLRVLCKMPLCIFRRFSNIVMRSKGFKEEMIKAGKQATELLDSIVEQKEKGIADAMNKRNKTKN